MADVFYPIVFGRKDKRLAEERRRCLIKVVLSTFSFLFTERKATIAPPTDAIPPFDYATVIVTDNNVIYRFTKGRNEERVDLGSALEPGRWHELSLVIGILDGPEEVQRGSIQDFQTAARLLKTNFGAIEEAFSETHYPRLKKQLNEIYKRDRVIMRQHEIEINRRLYE
jgi:hypothetical protein